MKQLIKFLFSALIALLVACSGGGTQVASNDGGISGTGDGSSKSSISGASYKGPLIKGSLIKVREIINGVMRSEVFTTNIASNKGDYKIEIPSSNTDGAIVSISSKGQFYNENTGLFSSQEVELNALIKASSINTGEQIIYVNSLTHLTHDYILQKLLAGKSYDDALTLAQKRVLKLFLVLTGERNISQDFHNMSIVNTSATNASDNAYLLYISSLLTKAVQEKQKTEPSFTLDNLFSILIEDVNNDTEIDDSTLQILQAAHDLLAPAVITQNLASILIDDSIATINNVITAIDPQLIPPTRLDTSIRSGFINFCYDGANCQTDPISGAVASNGMHTYKLQYDDNANFDTPISKALLANNNAVNIAAFSSGTHHARVRKEWPDGQYSSWTVVSFLVP